MSAIVQFDDERACWIFRDSVRGPAGSATVRLGGLLIAVDAAEPDRLLEVVLPEWQPGTGLPDSDLGLLGALFGDELADWLRHAETGQRREAQLVVGPAWEAIQRLALSLMLQRARRAGKQLAALDVARHAQQVGSAAASGVLSEACWDALPALTALGQMANRYPQVLARLTSGARVVLRELVELAERVLIADGLAERSPVAARLLADLAALLSSQQIALSDSQVEARWGSLAAEPGDQRPGRTSAAPVPDYMFVAAPPGTPSFRPSSAAAVNCAASTADVQIRMGHRSTVLLEGGRCVARGRVPGQVVVQVPLRSGASDADIAGLSVRLFTREGELLAQAPLQLDGGHGRRLEAVAKLTVERGGAGSQTVTGSDQVFVDVALDALPNLDQQATAGLTRGRAFRAGQRALAASAEGRSMEAVDGWQEAARLFDLAGEADLARRAAHHAEIASLAIPSDWIAEVLASVDNVGRELLVPGSQLDLSELARVGLELSMIAGTSPTLATIHARLGRAPRTVTGADNEDHDTERAAHLAEAVRILRVLGDQDSLHQARTLSREIHPDS